MDLVQKYYELEKVIGEGSYAIVLLARDKKTKKKYAIKHQAEEGQPHKPYSRSPSVQSVEEISSH
jgi:serine/threonine protein kinase